MAKAKGIDWMGLIKDGKEWSPAFLWTLLFAIYLLLNLVMQGWGHVAFPYTMVYTLGFLLIAITIAKATQKKAIGSLFAIMTIFVGMMTWITSMAYIDPSAGMWLTILFTVIAFANEYGYLETKASINNKYALLAALGGITLFGITYFLGRLGLLPAGQQLIWDVNELPWFTIVNHLGITLLAATDMLIILGLGTWKKWSMYRWIFFGLTVFGALMLIYSGWGLSILH